MIMEFKDRYPLMEKDAQNGLVKCDDFCGALENPASVEDYEKTSSGCSHGR